MENDVLYNRIMNVVHEEYGPPGEGTKEITIIENGTITEDVKSYASAEITTAVPNSYTESDEGKVVDNGALVSQSSATYTANDTYDTTLINSVTVNVSGGEIEFSDYVNRTLSSNTDIDADLFDSATITELTRIFTTQYAASYYFCRVPITSFRWLKTITADFNQNNSLFYYCSHLETFVLPNATGGFSASATSWFMYCTALKAADLGCKGIYQHTFDGCTAFDTLILRNSAMVTLNNINNFNVSPFASSGTGGTLYVPQDLISSYQSASNWSTILGYANNQIKSIESTHTDPNAPIDLTLYYVDGTPIPTP